jgi:hypothetical protein
MELLRRSGESYDVLMTLDELRTIVLALRESIMCIEEWEYHSRMEVFTSETNELIDLLNSARHVGRQ